jgi:hypothetical protein
MKLLRPTIIVLAWTISVLMIVQTAAAGPGKGGKGGAAAVGIDSVLLINPNVPGDQFITAEIVGGGFLGGNFLEVTLNGAVLAVPEASETMLIAKIPKNTPDGDYTLTVTTGGTSKQTASTTIRLGGEMIVSCISWFISGPQNEHVHTEIHVEDENGDAVIGAIVTWTSENDTFGVYQTNVSPTNDNDGHATELTTCPGEVSGSGVTDWFCCIGAGKFDGEVPGKRACDSGLYTSVILDVTAPPQTNMVWNEKASELEASITLDPISQ